MWAQINSATIKHKAWGIKFGIVIILRHLTVSVAAADRATFDEAANLDAGIAARRSHKAGTEFRASR